MSLSHGLKGEAALRSIADNFWLYMHEKDEIADMLDDPEGVDFDRQAAIFQARIDQRIQSWRNAQ